MRRKRDEETTPKILDVDASMQGTLTFKDPVNLRINGKFEGRLQTKGNLTIGEHSVVNADIDGEDITIAGRVNGDINAQKSVRLVAPACVIGDIRTPSINISDGAIMEGYCNMLQEGKKSHKSPEMWSIDDVSKYLEVDKNVVVEWADTGRLPAKKEGPLWRFEKNKIEDWLSNEKIK